MPRLTLRELQLSKMWQRIVKISSSALTVIYFYLPFSFACFLIIITAFHIVLNLTEKPDDWQIDCIRITLGKFMENVTTFLNGLHYNVLTSNNSFVFSQFSSPQTCSQCRSIILESSEIVWGTMIACLL